MKDETVFRLMNNAVGYISLNCGYGSADQSSLDILNDICCDYLKKITSSINLAQESKELRDESDFVDTIERVFHQLHIPSIANLHQFVCKMDAIKRHNLQLQQGTTQTVDSKEAPRFHAEG